MMHVASVHFKRHVSSVSHGCCKSRLGCCICCNGCTCMLQASIPNVSYVFSDVYCKRVYLDVAYVSNICKCFICMLHIFAIVFNCFCKCFRFIFQVFHLSFFMLQVLYLNVLKVD
jgi:hypothetical protein